MTKQDSIEQNKISFSKLFAMVEKKELIYFIIGVSFTIINGCVQPIFSILQGEIIQKFSSQNSPDDLEDGTRNLFLFHIAFGLCKSYILNINISLLISMLNNKTECFTDKKYIQQHDGIDKFENNDIIFVNNQKYLSSVMIYCFVHFGESQAIKFRLEYYKKLINQDVSYFDRINSNELATKISSDCFKIQQAIGEKLCQFLFSISIVVSSMIVSFVRAWQMTLIASIIIPTASIIFSIVTKIIQKSVRLTSKDMQAASGIVEQALSSIRTVKTLQGEEHETNRYSTLIKQSLQKQFSFNLMTGVAFGVQSMFYFFNFALPYWVGGIFMDNEVENDSVGRVYNFSDLVVVSTCLILAGFKLSTALNSFKIFIEAKAACSDIFLVLNQVPSIQQNEKGIKLENEKMRGQILFEKVKFSYPTRKDDIIFQDLSFAIEPHQKTAIVGKSGSGKSTILQLIEHFYEPIEGKILLDGIDIKDLCLESLRRSIGYVSQEPVLFATTIRENLRYAKPDATEQDMITALQQANIWEFINIQENKLDTFVGNNGTQLSGGQKQRICIARAILKNPSILILDEATSGLDLKNEREVQATLDSVSKDRTTIVIAHNLHTIQNANKIIIINEGKVTESGSHQELMQLKGIYYELYQNQTESMSQKDLQNERESQSALPQQNSTESSLSSSDSTPTKITLPSSQIPTSITLKARKNGTLTCLATTMNELNNRPQSICTLNHINDKTTTTFHQDHSFNSPLPEPEFHLQEQPQQKNKSSLQKNRKNYALKGLKVQIKKEENIQKSTDEKKQVKILNVSQQNSIQKQVQQPKLKKIGLFKILKRLLSFDKSSSSIFLGLFFSIGNGIAYPLCGWAIGKVGPLLLKYDGSKETIEESNRYTLVLVLIGVLDFFFIILQYFFSSKAAQSISFTLRTQMFSKYLRMPIAWFDQKQNNSSSLALNISQNCESIHTLIGQNLSFNSLVILVSSLLLCFTGDWRTSLVGLVLVPILFFSHVLYAIKISRLTMSSHKASINTINLINESACNIKTIFSFGNKNTLIDNFSEKLNSSIKDLKNNALSAGLAQGFANFALFFVYGILYCLGAIFNQKYGVPIESIFISINCLAISASGLGKSAFFMGDARSSIIMAKNVFKVLDQKDETQLNTGKKEQEQTEGEIEFKNVSFSYPERDLPILKNVSFKIPAKNKVAFVGTSGAGKSSILQLLQRFYSNYTGEILLDGIELKDYELNKYRSKLGAVQQEAILFNDTIKANIQYNLKNIEFEKIKQAAQQAQALSFIEEFGQDGFDKQVGLKGNMLSGGQKQRIAISQVILRQPQIVLFDEVTSALDSENEQVVSESISKAFKDHTTISVAHRLNTIIDCDIIFVLDNGTIVEQGTYQQLINQKSHFYSLLQQKQPNSTQLNEES